MWLKFFSSILAPPEGLCVNGPHPVCRVVTSIWLFSFKSIAYSLGVPLTPEAPPLLCYRIFLDVPLGADALRSPSSAALGFLLLIRRRPRSPWSPV